MTSIQHSKYWCISHCEVDRIIQDLTEVMYHVAIRRMNAAFHGEVYAMMQLCFIYLFIQDFKHYCLLVIFPRYFLPYSITLHAPPFLHSSTLDHTEGDTSMHTDFLYLNGVL